MQICQVRWLGSGLMVPKGAPRVTPIFFYNFNPLSDPSLMLRRWTRKQSLRLQLSLQLSLKICLGMNSLLDTSSSWPTSQLTLAAAGFKYGFLFSTWLHCFWPATKVAPGFLQWDGVDETLVIRDLVRFPNWLESQLGFQYLKKWEIGKQWLIL